MKAPKEGMNLQSTLLSASMLLAVAIVAGSWSPAFAQDCAFFDDFQRPDSTTVGFGWVEVETIDPEILLTSFDEFSYIDIVGQGGGPPSLTQSGIDVSSLAVPTLNFFWLARNGESEVGDVLQVDWRVSGGVWSQLAELDLTNTATRFEELGIPVSPPDTMIDIRFVVVVDEFQEGALLDDVGVCEAIDCNSNGIADPMEVAEGSSPDLNFNNVPDECDECVTSNDCNDGVFCNGSEECQQDLCVQRDPPCFTGQTCDEDNDVCDPDGPDCNTNGIGDATDIASGTSADLNGNSIPDECDACVNNDADCDNGDFCDGAETCNVDTCFLGAEPCLPEQICIESTDSCVPISSDCNSNGIGDLVDIAGSTSDDINANSVPDECDDCVVDGDCDNLLFCDGTETCNVDQCMTGLLPCMIGQFCDEEGELCLPAGADCNNNGIGDPTDIAGATSADLNTNGVPDECDECALDEDCDDGTFCNGPEMCSVDVCVIGFDPCTVGQLCDEFADQCQPDGADCNSNGIGDATDIGMGTSDDDNANAVPDECDECVSDVDCDDGLFCTGVETCDVDTCESAGDPCLLGQTCDDNSDSCPPTGADCNNNSIGDATDIAVGTSIDCNLNGLPDSCETSSGTAADCNMNAIPDSCELFEGSASDCDFNGVLDECDVLDGIAEDCDMNGLPDICQMDSDNDGVIDACDDCADTPSGLVMDSNGCPIELGPCCFFGTICIDDRIVSECSILGGAYMGDGLTCTLDPDGDGVTACDDLCPLDGDKVDPGVCGCGVPDFDTDLDGLVDCEDLCPDTPLGDPVNGCGCTALGACDFIQGFCWDDLDAPTCTIINGLYLGDGSACDDAFTFGDMDGDGDVDLADFAIFQECFNLSPNEGVNELCIPGDFDGCDEIDIADYEAFVRFLEGPLPQP